jgi:hypothetical protein
VDNRIKSLKEELLPSYIAVSKYQIYSRMLRTEELVEGLCGGTGMDIMLEEKPKKI